jgi:hypothetical protein
MIPAMSDDKTPALSNELTKLEKYYEIGDYRQAKVLAKTLRENYALTGREQERIDAVLNATKTDPGAIVAFVITLGLMLYLFVKYGT